MPCDGSERTNNCLRIQVKTKRHRRPPPGTWCVPGTRLGAHTPYSMGASHCPMSVSPPFVTLNKAFPTLLSICQVSVHPGHHFTLWTVLKDTDSRILFLKTPPPQVCGVTHATWLHIGPPRGSRARPRGAPRTMPSPWSVSSPEQTRGLRLKALGVQLQTL